VDWKFEDSAAKAASHFAVLTVRLEAAPFQSKTEIKATRRSKESGRRSKVEIKAEWRGESGE
jgi:hypothetical protein